MGVRDDSIEEASRNASVKVLKLPQQLTEPSLRRAHDALSVATTSTALVMPATATAAVDANVEPSPS
jgi:hypothetical protein